MPLILKETYILKTEPLSFLIILLNINKLNSLLNSL
jgi:hypothetical protein